MMETVGWWDTGGDDDNNNDNADEKHDCVKKLAFSSEPKWGRRNIKLAKQFN